MKLIISILRGEATEYVSQALISAGFRVTRIASTGGFLRRGSTTLMIGVEDEKVSEAIRVMRESCPSSADPAQKRATLFVLNVAYYEQL